MFICGTGSFTTREEDDNVNVSPCSTPKRSRRSTSLCRRLGRDSGNKNPYADRGLDKFYALLADLDDKKQKIYTQKGSEDIRFVRFVYDSDKVKPIVVKVKDKSPPKTAEQRSFKASPVAQPDDHEEETKKSEKVMKKRRSLRCKGGFTIEDLKHPHFYFPVMVILILLFLAIFGRSFAILCTSIGWYLAPTIAGVPSEAGSSERKLKRKKEYGRKKSEKMVDDSGPSSPKSVINGLNHLQHDRKRSW